MGWEEAWRAQGGATGLAWGALEVAMGQGVPER